MLIVKIIAELCFFVFVVFLALQFRGIYKRIDKLEEKVRNLDW